jgi:hypothetical protein
MITWLLTLERQGGRQRCSSVLDSTEFVRNALRDSTKLGHKATLVLVPMDTNKLSS